MSKKSRRVAKARRALLALSLVLVTMLVTVGGTIAWLTASTDEVTNTFTPEGIAIELIETKDPITGNETVGADNKPVPVTDWSVELLPGATYHKNPVVTVLDSTTVDVYLFVKFEAPANASYLSYVSNLNEDNDWHQLASDNTVWYRTVGVKDDVKSFHLIANDTVTIDGESLTKDNMPSSNLTMTYTAYASQLYKNATETFTPAEAWSNAQPATSGN